MIVVVVITVNVVVSKDSLGDGDEGDKLVMKKRVLDSGDGNSESCVYCE